MKALKFVYPRLYEEMRGKVLDQLEQMDARGELEKMPYQRRMLLGTLLEIPADASMRPEVLRALQALKKQDAPKPKGADAQQGGGRRPIKLDPGMFRTEAETIESGGRAS